MTKQNRFSEKYSKKSNDELENIIDNDDYQKEARLAATWELERRGEISEEDIPRDSEPTTSERVEIQAKKPSNVTDDPSAPLLYHSNFILVYGALFSVFLGGILLALNLKALNKTKLALEALVTSFIYTAVQITALNLLEQNSLLTLTVSLLGVYLIERIFWTNKIDRELKFRKRSIWVPLIIAILITAPLLYFIIANGV